MDEAYNYQKIYSDFIIQKTGNAQLSGFRIISTNTEDDNTEIETLDPNEMPEFEFLSQTARTATANSILDIGLLLLFNLLFFGGAFVAFTKYDLR